MMAFHMLRARSMPGWLRAGCGPARLMSNAVSIPQFSIVDSTLREGEQFATAEFKHLDRVYIAKTLDGLGVDYIEVVNPVVSKQAAQDCEILANLGLRAKLLAHTRCHMLDVKAAVDSGVDGVNVYMATSKLLAQHSHGKGMDAILEMAKEVIDYVKAAGLEVRFSAEDTFRSDPVELLDLYAKIDALGVDRVGLADTVGIATPDQVATTVSAVRGVIKPTTGIEFHTHDDTGCCIANAYMAVMHGATHIDTCVLGIGERNGITPLGGFLGRIYTLDKESIKSKYNLHLLHHLERYVAAVTDVEIPFNNYITGSSAFTHKAGVHSKAVMANPSSYEVINPEDFGVQRRVQVAHRLTGWNSIQHRAKQLSLDISDDQIKAATSLIKSLAEEQEIAVEDIDKVLYQLAVGPRSSSSSFMNWSSADDTSPEVKEAAEAAAAAMAMLEQAAAKAAVATVVRSQKTTRPGLALKVSGHLFDSQVINKVLDIVVDSPCDFQVVKMDVAPENHMHSDLVLQLWPAEEGEADKKLQDTRSSIEAFVAEQQAHHQCTISEVKDP